MAGEDGTGINAGASGDIEQMPMTRTFKPLGHRGPKVNSPTIHDGCKLVREVIAFPMNQKAEDLLMQAPAPADDKQLRELHLQLSPKAKALLAEETDKANVA